MTKEELARAIFEEQNKLRVLRGEEPIAPDSPRAQRKIWEDTKRTKPNLERELELVRNSCDALAAKNEHEAKVAAYFATPEGAAFKAETEATIENKIVEWQSYEKQTNLTIESMIQAALGCHWGVRGITRGIGSIGVIDFEKSTPEQREYIFGQHIEIRYELRDWDGSERFEANCGSCGSFKMDGGTTIGERAMFYAGIGRLFGDLELIASIKSLLKESVQATEVISAELDALRRRLANPFTEAE